MAVRFARAENECPVGRAAMIHLENLDAIVARLDLASARADGSPTDPLAAHEVACCLDTLSEQHLPSGLGVHLAPGSKATMIDHSSSVRLKRTIKASC